MALCVYTGNVSSVSISVRDYPPGDYNLTIMATDVFGQSVDEVVPFLLPGVYACMHVPAICMVVMSNRRSLP